MPRRDKERPFSDEYLLSYSEEHVGYEFDMFLTLSWLIPRLSAIHAPTEADGLCLRNAMLESCAIHLRNVIDFLYPEKVRKSDVVAADFFEPGGWNEKRPPVTEALNAARTRANKQIAHLTSARIAGASPEKEWDFPALAVELLPAIRMVAHGALQSRFSSVVTRRFE